jgi:nitrate reductase NapE
VRRSQFFRLIQINARALFCNLNPNQGNGPDAVPIPEISERPNMSAADDMTARVRRKRMEIFAFLFLTAVVMPVIAVGTVGSYGLAVWVYQMFAGPPGPPLPH